MTVVACHGGCGAATICRLLHPAVRVTVGDWDDFAGRYVAHQPLVVVARGTAYGMARAVIVTAAAHRVGLFPAVLVVVGDGPWPEPSAVRARARLVADRVGAVVRVPYVPAWRYVDDPLSRVPGAVVEAVRAIRTAVAAFEDAVARGGW